MGIRLQNWAVAVAVAAGIGGLALSRPVFAAPQACVVTSAGDIDTTKPEGWDAGSFRKMLLLASAGECLNNKITITVPKITMNAPLGLGVTAQLKGLSIEPGPGMAQAEIVVNYNTDFVAGCSAASPFASCFAYLPLSNVSIRKIRISVDPTSLLPPIYGLCIDKDMEKPNDPASDNTILIEDSAFDGFVDGGVVISAASYGVEIHRSTFQKSGDGIVIKLDPAITPEAPNPPTMGGSGAAVALADKDGKVLEYHLRGLAVVSGKIKSVELYERAGKAGSKFVQECTVTDKPIDGQWNVDCVLPKTIKLPYDYAVTVTDAVNHSTSVFATGTIPVDVAKVQSLVPLPAQSQVNPPAPKVDPKNPPVYQNPTGSSSGSGASANETKKLTLTATPGSSGGCSLIR